MTLFALKLMTMEMLDKVFDYMVAEPFRPFRIKLANREAFEIRYPGSIYVGINSLSVRAAAGNEKNEQWHRIPSTQVDDVEPLDNVR